MRKTKYKFRQKESKVGYFLLSPYLVYTAVFWIYPFIWGFVLSLQQWNIVSPARTFVGLKNFIEVLKSPLFWTIFKNTLYFIGVFIPTVTISALMVAVLINKIRYFKSFFIVGYMLSYVSASVGYAIVFSILFAGDGLINSWLSKIGIYVLWFNDPRIAMASIALIVSWKCVGYYALIFLAGLQAIPDTVYESARIDGASRWTQFWRITIPLLNVSFTIVLILTMGISFRIFAEPYIITGGGPMDTTRTFLLEIYYQTFEALHAGYGSALALIAASLSFVFVIATRKSVEREVY
ncbi:MAG: carbohydrate ABC transporter permease [bacterium]